MSSREKHEVGPDGLCMTPTQRARRDALEQKVREDVVRKLGGKARFQQVLQFFGIPS